MAEARTKDLYIYAEHVETGRKQAFTRATWKNMPGQTDNNGHKLPKCGYKQISKEAFTGEVPEPLKPSTAEAKPKRSTRKTTKNETTD